MAREAIPKQAGQPREVVIEFFEGRPEGLDELAGEWPEQVTLLEAKGFGAAEYTLQALVVLVPVVSAQIAGVVRAHIEARKSMRIKLDGVEFDGFTGAEAIAFLRELSEPAEPHD